MELTTFYDLETNGLFQDKRYLGRIAPLSLGYIQVFPDLTIKSKGVLYFYDPFVKISPGATEVNHLTPDFLYNYKDQKVDNIVRAFMLFSHSKVVGKNNQRFDDKVMEDFFQHYNLGSFPITESIDTNDIVGPEYKKLTGNSRKMGTLSDWVEAFLDEGEVDKALGDYKPATGGAHDALWDTMATYLLFKKFSDEDALVKSSKEKEFEQSLQYLTKSVQTSKPSSWRDVRL